MATESWRCDYFKGQLKKEGSIKETVNEWPWRQKEDADIVMSWKSLLNLLAPQPHSKLTSTLPTSNLHPHPPFVLFFPQTLIFTIKSSICGLSVQHLSCHTTNSLVLVLIQYSLYKIPTVAQYNSSPFSAPTPGWLDTAREHDMPKWGLMSSWSQGSSQCCYFTVHILILPIFSLACENVRELLTKTVHLDKAWW